LIGIYLGELSDAVGSANSHRQYRPAPLIMPSAHTLPRSQHKPNWLSLQSLWPAA